MTSSQILVREVLDIVRREELADRFHVGVGHDSPGGMGWTTRLSLATVKKQQLRVLPSRFLEPCVPIWKKYTQVVGFGYDNYGVKARIPTDRYERLCQQLPRHNTLTR